MEHLKELLEKERAVYFKLRESFIVMKSEDSDYEHWRSLINIVQRSMDQIIKEMSIERGLRQ